MIHYNNTYKYELCSMIYQMCYLTKFSYARINFDSSKILNAQNDRKAILSMISRFNQLSKPTIFIIALRDPNTKAIMLIMHIMIFFTATQLPGPKPVSQ